MKPKQLKSAMPKADLNKFKELILYVSQRSANDPNFGAVKLNKILHISDFLHYGHYGSAITGVEYQKLDHGPAPRPLLPIREKMIRAGELGVQALPIGSQTRQRPVNLRAPNLKVFSASEIALIDSVIDLLSGKTAKATSDLSHTLSGWKLARLNETIPYSSVFLCGDQSLTERDMAKGIELAKQHGLVEAAA